MFFAGGIVQMAAIEKIGSHNFLSVGMKLCIGYRGEFSKKCGFSLVELMAVIGVICVLAALVGYRYDGIHRSGECAPSAEGQHFLL